MKSKVTKYRITCAKKLQGRILDLGAGEGDYTEYLQDGNQLTSVDIDEENLKNIPGETVVASADNLPFADDTFDGVWSCAVLEHVETNYIPEAIRVTKPGGRIFILTPNKKSPFDPVKRILGFGDWSTNEGHVRLYTAKELSLYGRVTGEVWWFPIVDSVSRFLPFLGHTLMLDITVTNELKNRLCQTK